MQVCNTFNDIYDGCNGCCKNKWPPLMTAHTVTSLLIPSIKLSWFCGIELKNMHDVSASDKMHAICTNSFSKSNREEQIKCKLPAIGLSRFWK